MKRNKFIKHLNLNNCILHRHGSKKTLALINKKKLLEKFKERAKTISEESDGFGWGMDGFMKECYSQYYK